MTQNEIPSEWESSFLSDIVEIIRGVTYKKAQSSTHPDKGLLPVLRANNIQRGKLLTSDLVYVPSELVKQRQKLNVGDIVVAMSSGSKSVVGKAAKVDSVIDGSFGAFCGVLRPVSGVDSNYVSWFTHSLEYRNKVSSLSAGANINNLKPSHFDVIAIPIAPLIEQKTIAEKLDILLAQVESTKARLERIPKILKRFRQSVLAAAVSGKLTQEWRASLGQEIGSVKPLATAGKIIAGQSPSKSEVNFEGKGEPYVTGPEQWDGKKILRHKWTESPKRIAPNGSIFVTVKGAGVGTTFPGCYAAIGRDVYAFIPDENMNYSYILFAIQASAQDVVLKAKGLIPGLTKSDIIDHEIYLPRVNEQTEIVRRVDQLFAYADTIETQVSNALERVNNLTQSILARAFRGELTEQWRKDNPDLISGENSAEALLEKIKAERAAAKPVKRGRKKA